MKPTKTGVYNFRGEPEVVHDGFTDSQGVVRLMFGQGLVEDTEDFEWSEFVPDFSRFEEFLVTYNTTAEKALNLLAGNPDYGVCVMVWPWPDGGWYAGIAVTDELCAKKQSLPVWGMESTEGMSPEWDVCDGFEDGVNEHGITIIDALNKLMTTLLKTSKAFQNKSDK